MSKRKQLKVYYAHPMQNYDTKGEERDIKALEVLGFIVVNPNADNIRGALMLLDTSDQRMAFFEPLVKSADALAFRALPDGKIGAGVGQEIRWARASGIPVIELPSGENKRTLTVEETRERMRDAGYY